MGEKPALKKKNGSKLPHSMRSYLRDNVYHRLEICQEQFCTKAAAPGGIGDKGPVAQSEVCATGRFCWATSPVWLGFLYRFFGGGGFHGGGFGFGRGSHHGFGAPEVRGDFCDFVGRVAEVGGETIEAGLSGLDGIRVDLLEFLETLFAEDLTHGGIVVEAAHGRAQRGDVEGGAFASFDDLRNKYGD